VSAIAQPDREVVDRRAKGANLVFLNIPKLDALKARPGEHRTEYWDRGLHGFGVRVYANGRKVVKLKSFNAQSLKWGKGNGMPTKPGVYRLFCSLHPTTMTQIVIVR